MKTQNKFDEFFFRLYFILNNNNCSLLSRQLFSWFYRSTLSIHIKMILLKSMPISELEINSVLEVLKSNYQTDLIDRRNKEWLDFISGNNAVVVLLKDENKRNNESFFNHNNESL